MALALALALAMAMANMEIIMEPIENFSIPIKSIDKAEIYYTRGGKEFEQDVEIEIDYNKGYPATRQEPEYPEEAEITDAFGLSEDERFHWNKCLEENWGDIELQIFQVVAEEKYSNEEDEADYRYQQRKDRMIEENM